MLMNHIRNLDADQPRGSGSWLPPHPSGSGRVKRQRIDQPAAITAFTDYVEAVNRGKFTQAATQYNTLRELGVHVLYQRPQAAGSTS